MDDISNRTLAIFLIAAIVVSIGGTIAVLNENEAGVTGFATNNQTGSVALTVAQALSIKLTDATINFGTCELDTVQGWTYVDSSAGNTSWNNSLCTGADANWSTFGDWLTIQNDGNVDANVSVFTDTTSTDFFGGDAGSHYYYKTAGAGCDGRVQTGYKEFTAVGYANKELACDNVTETSTFRTYIAANITNQAKTGGTITLTFVAFNV